MSTLAEMLYVTLVADGDTPPDLVGKAGTIVALPPGTALPSGPGDQLAGVDGYARTAPGGVEWVMTGLVDPLMRSVNRIPGTGGWVSVDARDTFRRVARQMRREGVQSAVAAQYLTDLYAAAVAEQTARLAAG